MSFLFEKMSREECEAVREADGYDRGFECGKREGEAVGFKQGEADGFKRGETAGAENKAREIAINFKKAGLDIDVIAVNTGLSKEEIEKL